MLRMEKEIQKSVQNDNLTIRSNATVTIQMVKPTGISFNQTSHQTSLEMTSPNNANSNSSDSVMRRPANFGSALFPNSMASSSTSQASSPGDKLLLGNVLNL